MDVDIRGRVANVKLSRNRCLQPLFEAIMNSLHAIAEAQVSDGRIEIRIERDKSQKAYLEEDSSVFLFWYAVQLESTGPFLCEFRAGSSGDKKPEQR